MTCRTDPPGVCCSWIECYSSPGVEEASPMHCEKCGSADTEVIKCAKCGQKSRIKCANCAFSNCTDKYCEVISIKSKIKVLTYFAIILIVLMVLILPWV